MRGSSPPVGPAAHRAKVGARAVDSLGMTRTPTATEAAHPSAGIGPDSTLSPYGLAAVLALVALCVAMVAVAFEAVGARRDADRAAAAVLARADAWLDRIDAELVALEASDPMLATCDDAAREVLLRASLRSLAVQAFFRLDSDGQVCGPSPGRAFEEALHAVRDATGTAPSGLSLHAATMLAGGVVAVRPLADGARLAALVDRPRGRAALGVDARDGAALPVALFATGTAPLLVEAGPGVERDARAPSGPFGYRASIASARWPLAVRADIGPAALGRRLQAGAAPWALLAVALGAAVAMSAQRRIGRRDRPESRLRRALLKRQFEPVIQPIVDARSGACVGGEVLLRRRHPIRGLVSPAEFIALAEATGLIVPISDLLIAKARDQLAPIARRHPSLYFSFNVAPAQLQDPRLADRLLQAFDEASLPPARVLLEITERDAVDADAMRGAHALRERGFRIAIDDFGTGHSSLAALETLRVDRIKFDREFVRRIDAPEASTVVLDSMVALAQRLGTPVIAEGVETDAQWRWLAARGVEYLQGYLFARPMSVSDFGRWVDRAAGLEQTAPATGTDAPDAAPVRGSWAMPVAGARVADVDLDRLAADMRGADGLDVRDRSWRLRTYRTCFVATEAVDWWVARLALSREQAVRLGRRMAAVGLIEHVAQEHDFADAMLYFRFTTAADTGAAAASPVDLRELAREMRGERGPRRGATDWRGVRYRDTFTGAAATDWLRRRLRLDATQAEAIAAALLRTGAIRHVIDERPFRSNGEPFRFD